MAAVNGGNVMLGIAGGMAAATAMFYGITISQPFGAYTPVDQNEAWKVKTEDLMMEGKWVRSSIHQTCMWQRSVRAFIVSGRGREMTTAPTILLALQARVAAGPVHLNPISFKVSGAEYARQCLKPADAEDDE
jgi:hypothetical protein